MNLHFKTVFQEITTTQNGIVWMEGWLYRRMDREDCIGLYKETEILVMLV